MITWYQSSPTLVSFNVSQTRSDPLVSYFEAPILVRVHGTMGEMQDFILDNTVNNEDFDKVIGFEVVSIEFDPESDIISRNNTVILSSEGPSLVSELKVYQPLNSENIIIKKPDDLEVKSIRIFDILGRIALESSYQEFFNISTLAYGLHILQLETNKGVIHKTVLKQ